MKNQYTFLLLIMNLFALTGYAQIIDPFGDPIDGFDTCPTRPVNVTVTKYCGYTRLTKGLETLPIGTISYWQSSASGTSTSNSSPYINRTSGSSYYLRKRNTITGCWGPSRYVGYSISYKPSITFYTIDKYYLWKCYPHKRDPSFGCHLVLAKFRIGD